jgi:hypothetical protein
MKLDRGKRKHIDAEKVAAKAKAKADLETLFETGNETEYVAFVKRIKPDMTPSELVGFIESFREQRWQRSQKPSGS